MTSIAVAVCGPARPEALAGLEGAVRIGSAPADRNRFAAETDAEVVAFVDGDVVVPEGWLAALEQAWAGTPAEIAAIGGPIALDFPGGRPDWLSDELASAYAPLDLGPQPRDLDPLEQTMFAGNLSFRRRPLRGAGGFGKPVDGQPGPRNWLSEEHEAQRQLGHWGWLVRYLPELGVVRMVEPSRREILDARRAYGRRLGLAGSRDPGTARRQARSSMLGAIAVAGMGSRGLERRARATENRAAAAAEVVVKPDTPVESVSTGRTGKPEVGLILLYHRIADLEFDPLELAVSPANFREQLAVLREEVEPVAMDDIAATVAGGGVPAGQVAVTIDDGYADALGEAQPALREAGVPATLFAATGHIAAGRSFFWDEAAELIAGEGSRPESLEIDETNWPTRTAEERIAAFRALHSLLQPRPFAERAPVLERLREWAGTQTRAPRLLSQEQLAQIDDVGAHTRDHVNLAHQPGDVVTAEVEGSRDNVAEWTGRAPRGFSYPFGIPRHDVSPQAREAVKAAGFAYAVVNQPVPLTGGEDVFALPRFFAPDLPGERFRDWLLERLR